jgi:hypothetical protein
MYKKRKNKSNQNYEVTHKKIIRCSLLMRPVLEQDTCSKFEKRNDQETNQYCMTCKHSF